MRELLTRLWNDSAFFTAAIRGAIFIGAATAERLGYIDATTREIIQGAAIMLPAGQKNHAAQGPASSNDEKTLRW